MKRLKYFIFAFFTICQITGFSQEWNLVWEKDFGRNNKTSFIDVIADISGGYTLLGTSENEKTGIVETWLSRFNESGDTIWNRYYSFPNPASPKCLVQASDKGYLMALSLLSDEEENRQIMLIRTDSDGNELWVKKMNNAISCSGGKMASLGDGGFIFAGSKIEEPEFQELWLLKINSEGETIWEKTYTEDDITTGKSIKLLPDGGFAVASTVVKKGFNNSDIWILRTDENGEVIWSSRIPGKDTKAWPECVCCSPDNHLMVVGWHGTAFGDINAEEVIIDYDLWIGKFAQDGKLLWSKNIDSEGSEGGNNITMRPDGNFLIAGKKETSFSGKVGPWLIYIDAEGNMLNEHLIKFHHYNDMATKIINAPDSGFVVIGPGIQADENIRSFAWIMKYKSF